MILIKIDIKKGKLHLKYIKESMVTHRKHL